MKQTEISDRGLVRLLPATYHKPPALRGLVDTDDEMEILAEIEGLTSGRLLAERGRNPHLDPRELEVAEVVRVMNHPLAIGFVVANVDLKHMFHRASTFRQGRAGDAPKGEGKNGTRIYTDLAD